ncbi:MAG: MFS transporter [Alphaproteobacteria bacterium]|nr:MFS transporter [Alphaproteobacteria bacterium]
MTPYQSTEITVDTMTRSFSRSAPTKENETAAPAPARRAFRRIAAAGILFQGGAVTADTSTMIAGLVHQLTGSPLAVGAAAAISRIGWLAPQLIIGHLAQRRARRMPYYKFGAFGRAATLAALAALVWASDGVAAAFLVPAFFVAWTIYAFVSGVVAVPYNDIVARSIASERRSRLLALRFFGGGLLAIAVAAIAFRILERLPVATGYAVVLAMGAALFMCSAASFASVHESDAVPDKDHQGFGAFLREGIRVARTDHRFRLFLLAQWCGGAVGMALPFYVLVAREEGALRLQDVAVLVAAQTGGAILANALWGWWGDRRGKLSLLRLVAAFGAAAPILTLIWAELAPPERITTLIWFAAVFAILGAVDNGRTIAYLGYLMEISPDHRRPAYSGYFNALYAPVWILPVAAAGIAEAVSFAAVFWLAIGAALLQLAVLWRLKRNPT